MLYENVINCYNCDNHITQTTEIIAPSDLDKCHRNTQTFLKIRKNKSNGRMLFDKTTPNDNTKLREIADHVLTVPDSSPLFAPFGAVCLLQITACFCAEARGYDVDKPRNLAKSVTVE